MQARHKKEKYFFFEKKKQKTFTLAGRRFKWANRALPLIGKSFLVLFFKKELLPSACLPFFGESLSMGRYHLLQKTTAPEIQVHIEALQEIHAQYAIIVAMVHVVGHRRERQILAARVAQPHIVRSCLAGIPATPNPFITRPAKLSTCKPSRRVDDSSSEFFSPPVSKSISAFRPLIVTVVKNAGTSCVTFRSVTCATLHRASARSAAHPPAGVLSRYHIDTKLLTYRQASQSPGRCRAI
jgi:hypothetical protein